MQYALVHQPIARQSEIDEEITESQIKGRLADWYPQVNFNYSLQHNFQLQKIVFNGQTIQSGTKNVSAGQFTLDQTLFNRDVLLASRTAKTVRTQAKQNTASNRIDIAANVSKAFFDVLLTSQQIRLVDEDIVRLERSYKDAYNQYQGGVVDKTDYKRASIALNNAKAQKKSGEEQLKAKYASLKLEMGYPDSLQLKLHYDSVQLANEVFFDTLQTVRYDQRIEYQLLQTQRQLQEAQVKYSKWSFIPEVSAFADYNANYLDNRFSKLYGDNLPNSYAGVSLKFPIFQGGKRTQEIKQAKLQLQRVDWDIQNLKNNVNTQYVAALSAYKSNLSDYNILKDNLDLAQEVYNTINLQYRSGVKAYIEVVNAETDLRTAQVNYTNALYQVLSSKIDVQKALGTINP
ncbi:TolC family protein [Deminuibacter soli]|uniref:TolC family protein n=1 Tax=Deminuibacter soli TaxID=2291815 RepID=UPI001FE2AC5F|nr:TolC family protein [Deminuibacter soli]